MLEPITGIYDIEGGFLPPGGTNPKLEILSKFTGIDLEVAAGLPPERLATHYARLGKTIQIFAESIHPGSAGMVTAILAGIHSGEVDVVSAINNINSLMEYGKPYAELCGDELAQVDRQEIMIETQHFWRIMGIDEIHGSAASKRVVGDGDEEFRAIAGNFERTLGVVTERRIVRDLPPMNHELPVSRKSNGGAQAEVYERQAFVKRATYPNTTIMLSVGERSDAQADYTERLQELTSMFHKLITRYSLERAVMLMDYYTAASGLAIPGLAMSVVQEYVQDGERRVRGMTSGRHEIIVMTPLTPTDKPFGAAGTQAFEKKISARVSSPAAEFGSLSETSYRTFDAPLAGRKDTVMVFQGEQADVIAGLAADGTLEQTLNTPANGNGRIDVQAKATAIMKDAKAGGPDRRFISTGVGKAQEFAVAKWTNETMATGMAAAVEYVRELCAKPGVVAEVSLEAGHIHADREISLYQKTGMRAGAILDAAIRAISDNIVVHRQPMVDGDHVINRIDYDKYIQAAAEQGYQIDEIIFEESPLIRQIAIDILKTLIGQSTDIMDGAQLSKRHAQNPGVYVFDPDTDRVEDLPVGVILLEGDNLYLTIGDGKRIEIVDHTSTSFRNGCVLFDSALTLYRHNPEIAKAVYQQEVHQQAPGSALDTILAEGQTAHQILLEHYQSTNSPAARAAIMDTLFGVMTPTMESVLASSGDTPYLDALTAADAADEAAGVAKVTINVLEGFYGAQQEKLRALFKVLGINPHHITIGLDHSSHDILVITE